MAGFSIVVVVVVGVGLAAYAAVRDRRIELRAGGLVVVGQYGKHLVPWTEIRSIAQGKRNWSRFMTVATASQPPTRLVAPYTSVWLSRDADFDVKAAMVRSWWVAYRGPGCDAPSPPEAV